LPRSSRSGLQSISHASIWALAERSADWQTTANVRSICSRHRSRVSGPRPLDQMNRSCLLSWHSASLPKLQASGRERNNTTEAARCSLGGAYGIGENCEYQWIQRRRTVMTCSGAYAAPISQSAAPPRNRMRLRAHFRPQTDFELFDGHNL
jgi:hypothetical protein